MKMFPVPSSRASKLFRVEPTDLVLAALAPFVAILLRDSDFYHREDPTGLLAYAGISLVSTFVALVRFGVGRGVSHHLSFYDARQIGKACFVAVTITAAVAFSVTRMELIPRSLPPIHFLVLAISLISTRFLATEFAKDATSPSDSHDMVENVLIVGGNRAAWHYLRLLEEVDGHHLNVVAILDDDERLHGRSLSGRSIVGGVETAGAFIDEYATHGVRIARVIVAAQKLDPASCELAKLHDACDQRGVLLELLAERFGVQNVASPRQSGAATAPVLGLRGVPYSRGKRLLDIVISGMLLMLLVPFFLLVGLLIAIHLGLPVVFWQRRLGRDRRIIHVYKFRTLHLPMDGLGRQLPIGARLSKVGEVLRSTRVDELPQLYNVLRGDMSLVGPRPLLPVDQPKKTSARLSVRPGLTGWAQVHGGKLITPAEKNTLDEWYISNCSPLLDLKILLLTVLCVFQGDRRNDRVVQYALNSAQPESDSDVPHNVSKIR